MAIIGYALRQAFMPKHEYDNLRDEEKAWRRLQRPLVSAMASAVCFAVLVAGSVSVNIVFPGKARRRPFCGGRSVSLRESEVRRYRGAFYLTEEEAAEYYLVVVFIPSAILFFASGVYLFAGGVRCLSVLNIVFAVVFGLLALFLGSSLLTLGSSCSVPLFWCYEIASWGLVILYGGTAFFLRRKASMTLDQCDFADRNGGVEMLVSKLEVIPDMERL